jgi:hypothetical protein
VYHRPTTLAALLTLATLAPTAPAVAAPTTPTVVHHYSVPDDVEAARRRCLDAAEARLEAEHATDVPTVENDYAAWHAAGGPAVTAWATAVRDCRHRHAQPGGTWNWNGLTYVGSTTLS